MLEADFISSFNLLFSSFNSIILSLSTSKCFFCSFSVSCIFFISLSCIAFYLSRYNQQERTEVVK